MTTILVIDDTPDFLALVATQLERTDLKIFLRSHGAGAVEAVRARRPDLIVLALTLPDRAGTDVLRDLKACPATRDVPVVLVEEKAPRHQQQALRDQALAVLQKPIAPKDLLRAVRSVGGARLV